MVNDVGGGGREGASRVIYTPQAPRLIMPEGKIIGEDEGHEPFLLPLSLFPVGAAFLRGC